MNAGPITTVTLNPAIDRTVAVPGFAVGRVNRTAGEWRHAGGKGVNVATVLAGLGQATTVTGWLGTDNAAVFEEHFARLGLSDRFVRVAGATREGIKLIDERAGQTTDINFPGMPVSGEALARLLQAVDQIASVGGWWVLSGSIPPGAPAEVYATLADRIIRRGGRCVLDTSGDALRLGLSARPTVVKPNVDELRDLTGMPLPDVAAVTIAAGDLVREGVQLVVVSMGADGAVFTSADGSFLALPPRVEVRSTVGAGDAMVAGLVHGLSTGKGLADVARFATAVAADAVTRIGAVGMDAEALGSLAEAVMLESVRR